MAKRTIHSEPTNIPDDVPKSAALLEFGRRIQKAMIEKGWNQSELARAASLQGVAISRDLVSKYLNGKALPGPGKLEALSKALNVPAGDLLPTRGTNALSEKVPELDVRDVGDGRVWLRVNQAVDWPKALKIMELLKKA